MFSINYKRVWVDWARESEKEREKREREKVRKKGNIVGTERRTERERGTDGHLSLWIQV